MPLEIVAYLPIGAICKYLPVSDQADLLPKLTDALHQRLSSLSERDIKDYDPHFKKGIILHLQQLQTIQHLDDPKPIRILELDVSLKLLKSNFLEKRIRGLNEIKEMIEEAAKYRGGYFWSQKSQFLDTSQVVEWMSQNRVVETLTGESTHAELLKRSHELFELMGMKKKLVHENLASLWRSLGKKHESYVRAVYDLISRMPLWMSPQETSDLYRLISEQPPEFDDKYFSLIKNFSVAAIDTEAKQREQGDYGAELLFQMMVREMNEQALGSLIGLLRECRSSSKRQQYIEKGLKKFQEDQATPQCLHLVLSILDSFPNYDQTELLSYFNKRLNLTSQLTSSINGYVEVVRQTGITEDCVTTDKSLHSRNLQLRFQLLGLVIRKGGRMDIANLEVLWRALIVNPVLKTDSKILFRWLIGVIESGKGFSWDDFQHLITFFGERRSFDLFKASIESFEAFYRLFLIVNRSRGLEVRGTTILKRTETHLIGFDTALRFVLECEAEDVSEAAMSLIIECSMLLSSQANKSEIWMNLATDILAVLGEIDVRRVNRALKLCHSLIDLKTTPLNSDSKAPKMTIHVTLPTNRSEKITVPNDMPFGYVRRKIAEMLHTHPSKVRLRWARVYGEDEDEIPVMKVLAYSNSLAVEITRNLVDEVKPFELLAVDGLYDALFQLATHQESAQLAWDLLLKLPPSRSLRRSLERMEKSSLDPPTRQTFHKSLYSLILISDLCQSLEYADRFLLSEPGPLLIKGVFEMDIATLGCSGLMVVKFTEVVFALIRRMIKKRIALFDTHMVLNQSVNLLFCVAQNLGKGSERAIGEVQKLFDECCGEATAQTFASVLSTHPRLKETLLSILLQSDLVEIRLEMANLVLHLSKPPFDLSKLFLKILLELGVLALHEQHSLHFFHTVSKLVKLSGLNFADVLEESRKLLLESLPSKLEKNADSMEESLVGALNLLHSIGKTLTIQSTTAELEFILQTCLLDISPICKHPESRKAAFKLLSGMVVRSPGATALLLPHFSKLYEDPRWRTGRLASWEISSETGERSSTGFVGLRNTGCICYMISALQQLFMIQSFRSQLLGLEFSSHEDKDGNLVWIFQRILAGLKYSNKQCIGIKRLCKALEDSTVVNVNEQMDVEEFLNAFMDQLEGKLGHNKAVISNHFGGQLATEIIGKGACGHTSERVEAFLTLPIEVKDKKSLTESLESLVSGETLEGENAYQCDLCNAKVTAQRRVGLRYLPNILILALRRFDYNLDTMRRVKLNDYYEFPWELDLEPYTIEGLHRRDAANSETGRTVSERFPEDYYQYRLRGIVIHMGYAEGGHYYSYIQDRASGKWFEFNDTVVREIDQLDIPSEAFGGEEKFKIPSYYGDVTEVQEKVSSAYLLIYERAGGYAPRGDSEKEIRELTLPTDVPEADSIRAIIEKINEKNQTFWRRKNAFAVEFVSFVVKLAKEQGPDLSVFKLTASVFVAVVCRSKDRAAIHTLFPELQKTLKANAEAAKWYTEMISVPEVAHELLLVCPYSFIRRLFIGLMKSAIGHISIEQRTKCAERVLSLLSEVKASQHYTQYFELVYLLLKGCQLPSSVLLADSLIAFVMSRQLPSLPSSIVPCEAKDAYLGYLNFEPPSDHFKSVPPTHYPSVSFLLGILSDLSLSPDQKREMVSIEFFKECLHKLEGKSGARWAGRLYATLAKGDGSVGKQVIMLLLTGVGEGAEIRIKMCLRILAVVLGLEDNLSFERAALALSELSIRMKDSSVSREKTKTELIGLFIYKQTLVNVSVRQWVLSNYRSFTWVEEWVRKWTYSSSFSAETLDSGTAKRIKTLSMGRVMVIEDEWNSDDDVEFRTSSRVMVLNSYKYTWEYATVMDSFGEVARIRVERDGPLLWMECDSEEVRPYR